MLVKAGQPVSLEVTFDSPTLFVAAKIFDDSGVSPVLVATLAMDSYFGNSYRCKFTPVVGKTYVTNKSVYTDGTFTTIDISYSQGSDSFKALDFAAELWDALTSAHQISGSFGAAIAAGGGDGSGIIAIISDDPIVGTVEDIPIIGVVT